jgi:hypothetical protein
MPRPVAGNSVVSAYEVSWFKPEIENSRPGIGRDLISLLITGHCSYCPRARSWASCLDLHAMHMVVTGRALRRFSVISPPQSSQ